MDYVLKDKIRIGISACCFGARTRYNHRGWDYVENLGRQQWDYEWTPVCPEVIAGLGVPRDPVRMVSGSGDDLWQGEAKMKNRHGRNVTGPVKDACREAVVTLQRAGVDAFAFMEGSPTCGVYRTTLKEKRLGRPPGAFGSLLLKEDWFLIPAINLQSPWKWWDWSRRLDAFVWLKRQEISGKADIYDIWHALKFLCQEADEPEARRIGTDVAAMPKKLNAEFIAEWRSRVLRLLRRPSTLPRISNALFKHYKHYRRTFGLSLEENRPPRNDQSRHVFVEEVQKLERQAFDQGYQFAGRPVIYRPSR
ncbi:MAG: DUF523 domain-containing protein [Candidatus Omnitrophota bacterium]